jgi:type II secretory pathway component PulC
MVRGLIIRKTFIVIDLALAVLVAVVAGLVAMEMNRIIPGPDTVVPEPGNAAEATAEPLPQVGDRAMYASLKQSGLFGEAGKWDPKAEAAAAPKVEEKPAEPDVSESTLNLRLLGTVALGAHSKFSTAFIENLDANDKGRGYWIGDQVLENVTLEEVSAREVIVLNKRFTPPKRERVKMDEDQPDTGTAAKVPGAPAAPAASAASGGEPQPSDRISLKRDEMMQELTNNYADLVTNLKPEMARDDKGNVIGVTAPNIGRVPMAQKLGFKDKDILQTVNNEQIDSEQKIMEMVTKYQTATSFKIGIMRDGKPKVITYHLD